MRDSFSVTHYPTSAAIIWLFSHGPVETGAWETDESAATWATVIVVSNKLSFISDPGVPYLLPASLKLLGD